MTTTLTYFDFDGSRGLECRLALSAAGVDFHDDRITREQWAALKPTVPFGALPVLTRGDKRIAQSNAILRFVGATAGLHPADPWLAAEHDALMQSVEDLRHRIPGSKGKSDDEVRAEREAFASGWLRQWATSVSDRIVGPFVDGDTLNVVDIKLCVILRSCLGGVYDHVPVSTFSDLPKLATLKAAVEADPGVAKYLASR